MTKKVNRQGGAPPPGVPASTARHGEGDASPPTPHSTPAREEVFHIGKDPEDDAEEDSNDDGVEDDDDDSEYTYETDDDGSNQKKGWFGFLQQVKHADEDSSDSEAEEEAEGSDDGSEYTYVAEQEDGSVNKKRGWFEFLRRGSRGKIKHNGDHEDFFSSDEEDGYSSEEEDGREGGCSENDVPEKGKKGSKKKGWFELLSLGRKEHSNGDIDKSTFSEKEEDLFIEETGAENKSTDNDVDDNDSDYTYETEEEEDEPSSQKRGLFGFLRRGNRNPGGDHEEPICNEAKDAHGSHNNQRENGGEDASKNQGGQFIFFL